MMSPRSAVPSAPGNCLPVTLHMETPCLKEYKLIHFDAYLSYSKGFSELFFFCLNTL